jgi:CRP/FNR family transcriptional regulator
MLIDTLQTIPYLGALPEAELRRLAARCTTRDVARGAMIFEEGRPAVALTVILAGRAKLVRTSSRGREQILHTEGPGATLGEVPVFDGGGYVASAVALAPSRVLSIPRDALLALCQRRPDVALGIVAVLARRLRGFADLVEDLALRDVTARVAGFLAAEAARTGSDQLTLTSTQEEIAARLGTVRELVSRGLSRLQEDGILTVRRHRVQIKDRGRLASVADHGAAAVERAPPRSG